MSGDPADVGRAPVDVLRVVVERELERGGRVQHVAARGVEHALGLARRAAGKWWRRENSAREGDVFDDNMLPKPQNYTDAK